MYNSFQIFEKDNKSFHWTKGNILFAIMILAFLINAIYDSKVPLLRLTVLLSVFAYIPYVGTQFLRAAYLKGKFTGILKFNDDHIMINDQKIEVNQIQKIFLSTNDYYKRQLTTDCYIPLSNGTNNLLDLELKNNEKIKLFFLIEYEHQVEELQPFIITLIKNHLIIEEKAIQLLRINNDYMMDKFKEKLNN